MISQERLLEVFEYKEGKLFWKSKPSVIANRIVLGQEAGWIEDGYRSVQLDGNTYLSHRLIYIYHYGKITNQCIDHIDGDPLNNKIENLRECSFTENQWNSKLPKTNKSGVKGVSWNEKINKWVSQCYVNKKNCHIGYFDSLEEAIISMKKFRNENHKEFANHG